MLQQDLHPDQDQDDAPEKLCLRFKSCPEYMSYFNTCQRQSKRDHTDKTDSRNDIDLKKGKGHAHGKSINAGGHSKSQHPPDIQRTACGLTFLRAAGLPYHIAADDGKQDKCDPVIHRSNHIPELHSQKISDKRHQSLKSSEIDSHDPCLKRRTLLHGKALTDGHRKSVHRKSHCNQKKLNPSHLLT